MFIHTPKCAGTYVNTILSHLKIQNNGHNQAPPDNEYIYFTVIRNPVERFESLLNYRLGLHRNNWPTQLLYVFDDKNIQLDEIVSKMSDTDILSFSPYRTLTYYTKNVDIILTVDNLPTFLAYFGYVYDINSFKTTNVSNKIRGKLNQQNKERLKKLFNDDVVLYDKVINSMIK